MTIKRFTKMEYKSADDLIFGEAKYPVSYGLGQKIGSGHVVPEINFAPRPGAEKNPATLTREYVDYITKDILDRAVTLGFPAVQLENEHIWQMVNDPQKFEKPVEIGRASCRERV
jgi:methanol--5-hydroxybenzimidazolylcobamide Co-methyltransferase